MQPLNWRNPPELEWHLWYYWIHTRYSERNESYSCFFTDAVLNETDKKSLQDCSTRNKNRSKNICNGNASCAQLRLASTLTPPGHERADRHSRRREISCQWHPHTGKTKRKQLCSRLHEEYRISNLSYQWHQRNCNYRHIVKKETEYTRNTASTKVGSDRSERQ